MTSRPVPGLSELPDEVAGAVVVLALAGGSAEGAIAGRAGEACRAALRELAELTRAERAQAMARLIRQVGAPIPDGIEAAHPSWLRAALEEEATEVLAVVVQGAPEAITNVAREIVEGRGETWQGGHEPVSGEGEHPNVNESAVGDLRRTVFAAFARMSGPPSPSSLAELARASSLAELARTGASLLGASLAGAPAAAIARAAAQAGTRELGELIIAAARAPISPPERDRARRIIATAAPLTSEGKIAPLEAVGLVELAASLAGELPSAVRASAQRLPIALGKVLLDLHARARDF